MMKKLLLAAVLLFGLPSFASAQCDGVLASGAFCGNSGASPDLAGEATPNAMFDRAICATNNSAHVRIAGSWVCLASANNGVWVTSAAGVPSISSTLPNAVQDNITRLGTVTLGTWSGTVVGATFGGTGQSSYAVGDILYASTISVLSKLAGVATGNALISGGVSTAPSWGKIGLTTHVSGTLAIGSGGTGQTTQQAAFNALAPTATVAGSLAYWNGTNWVKLDGNASGTNVLTENASGVPSWAAAGTGTVTSVTCGTGLSGGTFTTTGTCAVALTNASNSLGADVALNNTANYFDGPSAAQGTSGTWFCSGTVVVVDTSGTANFAVKLWDGVTTIASTFTFSSAANIQVAVSVSGILATPAGNIRISVKDVATVNGLIKFNSSGNSKDSTVTCIRIG